MSRTISPEIVHQAAEWAAMLDDDQVSGATRAACERWCAANPEHRRTLQRMRGVDTQFEQLADIERDTLREAVAGRGWWRPAARAGLGVLLLAGAGWLAATSPFVRERLADARTATGEQRSLALADGSRVVLDTATVADTRIGDTDRHVTLYRGQVFAEVARDPARPFVVETSDGTATALGTAFTVRRGADATQVTVLRSRVRVCADSCIDLAPGERARLAGGGVTRLSPVDPYAAEAWTRGWLEADDLPLGAAIAELNRYRAHPIAYDPALLRGVRVTGSYPLTDSDRAIEAIAAASGLTVERQSPTRVRITR